MPILNPENSGLLRARPINYPMFVRPGGPTRVDVQAPANSVFGPWNALSDGNDITGAMLITHFSFLAYPGIYAELVMIEMGFGAAGGESAFAELCAHGIHERAYGTTTFTHVLPLSTPVRWQQGTRLAARARNNSASAFNIAHCKVFVTELGKTERF